MRQLLLLTKKAHCAKLIKNVSSQCLLKKEKQAQSMKTQTLLLTNTLTGKKEPFNPQLDAHVSMYVCGVTPYDHAHIGHGRCYVTFDTLYRLLHALGYNVKYVRNFTDIDDKLLNRAQKELGDRMRYGEVAQRYIKSFMDNMRALACLTPTVQPRVTESIPGIIDLVQKLVDSGHAYVVDGDVYYDVASFPAYGKLSKRKLDDLIAGARVEVNEKKKNPLDFALWKGEAENTFWHSPWGWGRPGWHIECSAMAKEHLGEHIDIHGGGMDLIFPHHENEIAQSEGVYGEPFARFWMHNAFVQINKEKMSKSLGNFFTLNDVLVNVDPMVLRFYYLNHNYTIPLDFSFESLAAFEKSYKKLVKLFAGIGTSLSELKTSLAQRMMATLCDDLNVAGALGIVFEHADELKSDEVAAQEVKWILQNILGLSLEPIAEKIIEITPEIQQLIDERAAARVAKDWKRADALRDELKKMGIEVQDKK